MEITEVKVFPVNEERLKAYATITFDNCFIIRDLKVIQGNNGLFIAMPSKKRKDGTYRDTAHPLNNETRNMIQKTILEKYEETSGEDSNASSYEDSQDEGDSGSSHSDAYEQS
jgi:stage V sporulation protein G